MANSFGGSSGKSSGSSGDLGRIAQAAATHGWDLEIDAGGSSVMATRDSGQVGLPWVVIARGAGRVTKISLYHPGDALDAEGEEIAHLQGNPRVKGRQLRVILEDLTEGIAK